MPQGRQQFESAKVVLQKILSSGHSAAFCGRCVREIISGTWPAKYIVFTDCPGDVLDELFQIAEIMIGNARVRTIFSGEAEVWLQNRDEIPLLTVDCLRMDAAGRVGHNFLQDLQNRIAEPAPGRYEEICKSPELAIQALTEAVASGLDISRNLERACIAAADFAKVEALGRPMGNELLKISEFGGKIVSRWLRVLDCCKLLEKTLPEFHKMKACRQKISSHPEGATVRRRLVGGGLSTESEPYDPSNPTHQNGSRYCIEPGTVFDHVLHSLGACRTGSPLAVLGTMFHDVGKPSAMRYVDGVIRYKGHDNSSYFLGISRRLELPKEISEFIRFCIDFHMEVHRLPQMALQEAATLAGDPRFPLLLEVVFADTFCAGTEGRPKKIARYEELQRHAAWMLSEGMPDRARRIFAAIPGRKISQMLELRLDRKAQEEIVFRTVEHALETGMDPANPSFFTDIKKFLDQFG